MLSLPYLLQIKEDNYLVCFEINQTQSGNFELAKSITRCLVSMYDETRGKKAKIIYDLMSRLQDSASKTRKYSIRTINSLAVVYCIF